MHLNQTLHVTEYYDNVGRIESYSAFRNNATFVNYDTMEVSHIMTGTDGQKSYIAVPLATIHLNLYVSSLVHTLQMVQLTS